MSREPKKAEQEPKRKAPITGRKYEEDLDLEEDEDVDMDNLEEDEFDEDVEMEAGDGVETGVEGDAPAGLDGEQAKRLSKGKSPPSSVTPIPQPAHHNITSLRSSLQPRKPPCTPNNLTEQPFFPPTLSSKTPSCRYGKTLEEPTCPRRNGARRSNSCTRPSRAE